LRRGPVIESGALLADAARPEPIHQHPKAVRGIRFVVDALDLNVAALRDLVRGAQLVQITGG
jgi:hypothetical protein